jgi:hypothetical protein
MEVRRRLENPPDLAGRPPSFVRTIRAIAWHQFFDPGQEITLKGVTFRVKEVGQKRMILVPLPGYNK